MLSPFFGNFIPNLSEVNMNYLMFFPSGSNELTTSP
jgi:hypothetical protein